jgi:DNA-directed RNA polymerase specialized sigma subunit
MDNLGFDMFLKNKKKRKLPSDILDFNKKTPFESEVDVEFLSENTQTSTFDSSRQLHSDNMGFGITKKEEEISLGPNQTTPTSETYKPKPLDDLDITDSSEEKKPKLESAWEQWDADRTPENLGKLLQASSDIISSAIRTYAHGNQSPILESKAKLIIADAIERYDKSKNIKLSTYLYSSLASLRREVIQSQPIYTPERIVYDAKRIDEVVEKYTEENGLEPDISIIADETGLSRDRIEYVLKNRARITNEGKVVDDTGAELAPGVYRVTPQEQAKEYIYDGLSHTDKLIFDYRFGEHGKHILSANEIAAKLNITPSAVSQRAANIARELNELQQILEGM